jgi:D-lactate dehydrogenase (cytochrome)
VYIDYRTGNFHTQLLFKTEEELAKIKEVVERMVHRSIALDGTCTSLVYSSYHPCSPIITGSGEHGIGIGKKEYLYEELGEGTVDLMKKIKRTLDPRGIMNPGKVGHLFILDLRGPDSERQLYPDEKPKDQ